MDCTRDETAFNDSTNMWQFLSNKKIKPKLKDLKSPWIALGMKRPSMTLQNFFEEFPEECEGFSKNSPRNVRDFRRILQGMWEIFEEFLEECERFSKNSPRNVRVWKLQHFLKRLKSDQFYKLIKDQARNKLIVKFFQVPLS